MNSFAYLCSCGSKLQQYAELFMAAWRLLRLPRTVGKLAGGCLADGRGAAARRLLEERVASRERSVFEMEAGAGSGLRAGPWDRLAGGDPSVTRPPGHLRSVSAPLTTRGRGGSSSWPLWRALCGAEERQRACQPSATRVTGLLPRGGGPAFHAAAAAAAVAPWWGGRRACVVGARHRQVTRGASACFQDAAAIL